MSRYPRLSTLLLLLLCVVVVAPGRSSAAQTEPERLIERLRSETNGKVELANHVSTGQIRFIGAGSSETISQPVPALAAKGPEHAARGFLASYGALFGLRDQSQELALKRVKAVDRGRSFVRFQQVYQQIPIFGGELMVQVDGSGNIASANGEVLPNLTLSTTPKITADQAVAAAVGAVSKWYNIPAAELKYNKPDLWIYNPSLVSPHQGESRLVWRFEIKPRHLAPIRELVLIDAERGSIALNFNQVDTALSLRTYDANNNNVLPGTLRCREMNVTCTGGDTHEVAAHVYAGDTYNYFKNEHNRDSIDGLGMTIISSVHFREAPAPNNVPYDNAFWDGKQMVYGDAYGFPLADDVVAHEITHGVTEKESNLFYYYQSGAINESLSDLWGEFVDLNNVGGNDDAAERWNIGEDVTGLGTLRDMEDPTQFNDPDSMVSVFYAGGESDNGGVHANSGINNKAASLMVDGGTHRGITVNGLGISKVADIYYEAAANMLLSGSDYADLYNILYQACINLTSPDGTGRTTFEDCLEVRAATDAVAMNGQPVAGYNTDPALCTPDMKPKNVFFDKLEGGTSKWTFTAKKGTVRWRLGSPYGPYASSGTKFLFADDYPAAPTDSMATMVPNVLVPRKGFLSFTHAYDFENGNGTNYDGGVLEYTINNGSTWVDARPLIVENGYKGALSTSWDNPLGGRLAFVGPSHGYITTKVNLASLAGKRVRFRWRMALDRTGWAWGWWLDNVRIYSCVPRPIATIAGEVVASADPNVKIGGAQVYLSPTISTTTDISGTYTFSNVYGGIYNISVTAPNYATATAKNVIVAGGQTTEVNFSLAPSN